MQINPLYSELKQVKRAQGEQAVTAVQSYLQLQSSIDSKSLKVCLEVLSKYAFEVGYRYRCCSRLKVGIASLLKTLPPSVLLARGYLPQNCSNVRNLSLHRFVPEDELDVITRIFSNVEFINFEYIIGNKELQILSQNCKKINRLDIKDAGISFDQVVSFVKNCPITSLNFHNLHYIPQLKEFLEQKGISLVIDNIEQDYEESEEVEYIYNRIGAVIGSYPKRKDGISEMYSID